jgi:hypothetical protein
MGDFGNPWLGSYAGLRLIETTHMVIGPFEDWSQVRSHGRARRRRAKHPQRIRLYYKPDPNVMHDKVNGIIYGHPATLAQLRHAVALKDPRP